MPVAGEGALRPADRQYQELVDGLPDIIVAMTPAGVLTTLNPAFEAITGMPRAEWIGKPFAELLDPRDGSAARSLFQAALDDTPCPLAQLRLRTADGGVRIAELLLVPQRKDQNIVGVIGIARDATDRVQLEEELRQSQKMAAAGRLAGGIAHDLNNILMVIQATAGFLVADLAPDDPRRADVNEITAAAQRATALTRQLLTFGRRQVQELQVVDLNRVVESLDPVLRGKLAANVDLSLKLHAGLAPIMANPAQVDHVIMHLVANARDAMPNGGSIQIRTANLMEAGLPARNHPGTFTGPGVILSVSDTGVGMDEETRSLLFEPFFTTKPAGQGTGLGLTTVHGIVEQLGGGIRVTSEVGRGTTVEIAFPGAAGPDPRG